MISPSRFRSLQPVERAVVFMLIAAVTLPGLSACAKYLSDYSVVQITWARYAGHFAFMVVVFAPRSGLAILRSARPRLQLTRSALHCASAILTFVALGFISLATSTAIFFSGPLMVTALAPFVLREQLGWDRALAVVVGFAGALVVVRPGWTGEHFAALLMFASAAASAAVQLLSRKLAAYDQALTSNTYMVLIGFLAMSLPLPFVWRMPDTGLDALAFVLIGCVGGLGHYFLVRAFELAPASVVSPLNYAQIVGAIVLGYILFGELPDIWTWVGSAIIAFSGIFILVRERRDPNTGGAPPNRA
jgi:drug/metabolite transporter (DMT)-like permease